MPNKKTTGCPVEPYARKAAKLLLARGDTHNGKLSEATNLGEDFARDMLFQQIDAIGVLASYEPASSDIGRIYQLMLARHFMLEPEPLEEIESKLPHLKPALRRVDRDTSRAIEAVLWSLLEPVAADPDIALLREHYGPMNDEPEEHQNKPHHVVLMDYVSAA